jgi:hypothetical protein
MELQAPIPFPPAGDAAEDQALSEVDVRVAGLDAVVADRVAGVAAARSWSAGLHFHIDRSADCATFTVGPIV